MSIKGDIGVIGLAVMGQNLILTVPLQKWMNFYKVQQKARILSGHTR